MWRVTAYPGLDRHPNPNWNAPSVRFFLTCARPTYVYVYRTASMNNTFPTITIDLVRQDDSIFEFLWHCAYADYLDSWSSDDQRCASWNSPFDSISSFVWNSQASDLRSARCDDGIFDIFVIDGDWVWSYSLEFQTPKSSALWTRKSIPFGKELRVEQIKRVKYVQFFIILRGLTRSK